MSQQICCPVCWKAVKTHAGTVAPHVDTALRSCPMSRQPVPARSLREIKLEETAAQLLRLAADLHDDVQSVWRILDRASNRELRDWLIIALAAVNIERQPSELLSWVQEFGAVAC